MTAVNSAASQQAVVEAALVLLERMGLSPADLTSPIAGRCYAQTRLAPVAPTPQS